MQGGRGETRAFLQVEGAWAGGWGGSQAGLERGLRSQGPLLAHAPLLLNGTSTAPAKEGATERGDDKWGQGEEIF